MQVNDIDQILNALSVSVFFIDEDRKIVYANRTAKNRFGADIINDRFVRIVRHPECLAVIDSVMMGEKAAQVEITQGVSPSATYIVHVLALGKEVSNGAKIALTFEDISQIKDAQLMRSEFVANVSHELRSPLTALAGFVETLRGPAKNDENASLRFLQLMENEAARMKRLIDDLLSLSTLQAQERIRPSGQVDITALIEHVVATLMPVAKKERKTIDFIVECEQSCITGDQDELIQVFHNIIENAVKYGVPDSQVTITVSFLTITVGVEGHAICVSVRDSGPGIKAEDIPRLTERFYRVDKSRSRIKGGTGLGLAIVKHILNRHRGRLQIESKVDEGSVFSVFLPACNKKSL